ncbi:MAG: hypothetical protein AB8C46_11130 [Burkholderiaceae bacterium]
MKPTSTFHRQIRLTACAGSLAIVLSACGGGGGGTGPVQNDPVGSSDSDVSQGASGVTNVGKNCQPGILSGFGGNFDDSPVLVQREGEEGIGGEADGDGGGGSDGIGMGGALGQFENVQVSVEFASGETFGPVAVDPQKGMVTVVPCGLMPPALVVFSGEPGSGARYFDEALEQYVSFEGRNLRTIVTDFRRNAGITTFTEAMVRRTFRLAPDTVDPASNEGWANVSRVDQAHGEVAAEVNDQLPGAYRLTDLRRLPVILNDRNFTEGSGVLSDNQNGRYGAALAGLARVGGANLGEVAAPALEINEQLAQDLADGEINMRDGDTPVAGTSVPAYTDDQLWSQQTLETTESAQRSGTGELASTRIPLSDMLIDYPSGAQERATFFSDGTMVYETANSTCPNGRRVDTIENVQHAAYFNAIGANGKSYIFNDDISTCRGPIEARFDIPGVSLVNIDEPNISRATDGKYYGAIVFPSPVGESYGFYPIVFDAPIVPVKVAANDFFLYSLSVDGQLYRESFNAQTNDFFVDNARNELRTLSGSSRRIEIPGKVVQIGFSGGTREFFALNDAKEVYWVDVRSSTGRQDPNIAPTITKLDLAGPVCSISNGLITISCDGSYHQKITGVTDTSAPAYLDRNPFFIPGVGGLSVSDQIPAVTPIWRSTDEFKVPEGASLPDVFDLNAVLIGVDGTVRNLDGTLVLAQ